MIVGPDNVPQIPDNIPEGDCAQMQKYSKTNKNK